jgi:hypothetical protein
VETNGSGQGIQELIKKTLELRQLWEERRLEAERQIKVLDSRLAAYQRTLRDYWESIHKIGGDDNNSQN